MAYKRRMKRGEPLVFPVTLRNPYTGEPEEVTITAKHLWGYEYSAIEQRLIGLVKFDEADLTGEETLKERRLRAKEYVLKIEGVDPEDAAEFGGLQDAKSCAKYIDAPGNEDLAFMIDPKYRDRLFRPEPRAVAPNSGEGDGSDAVQAAAHPA